MPEFRKWILALAGTALFAGLASAQVGIGTGTGSTVPTCTTTNGAVTPTVRADGYTELVGDIIIACTGGTPLALGSPVPTANITIFLNTAVTSRLLSNSPTAGSGTVSEALLLIDEPGSALTGYGPSNGLIYCGSGSGVLTNAGFGAGPGGCSQFVGAATVAGNTWFGVPVASAPTLTTSGTAGPFTNSQLGVSGATITCTPTTPCASIGTSAANAFQGVVFGNQVTFFGVPVLPPSSAGASRVFRITNIRANANGITGGGPVPGSITASISVSGSNSLPITNSTLTVGFVQQGLNPSNSGLRNSANTGNGGANFNQCTSVNVGSTSSTAAANGGLLQFQENFATAFKTRTSIVGGGNVIGGTPVTQNIPGTIYNSESGFVEAGFPATVTNSATGTTFVPGLADFGTRLKAVFSNVPTGVSVYVSVRDLTNSFNAAGTANAVLVVSETAGDSGAIPAGPTSSPITLPQASQTAVFGGGPSNGVQPGIAPVFLNGGTGQAVWEVVGTNPSAIDTLDFGVYINYSASPATNSPAAPSSFTVTLSFAPTPSGGGFTAAQGAQASATLPIPRFSDTYDITKTFANFALCTTNLLYPYVVNTAGFDTGIAIANTTTDPFGTSAQQGTCALNFYGSTQPSAAFVTPTIATGTVYANLASTVAPGFSGYMIAVCNFQYAHGFAFVSDVGARNLAMGYLALILPTPRSATESLNN